jgi:hypothetical protein
LHGSIEGIGASTLGVSNSIDFGTLGARSYVFTFGSFGFLRQKESINLCQWCICINFYYSRS